MEMEWEIFRGLIEKLDYLQDLGVTALWLLPFNSSPLRDDGYDVADYTDVHPTMGHCTIVNSCCRKPTGGGYGSFTELVLNHTSDQHPWFRRAQRAKPGSPWARFLCVERVARKVIRRLGSSSRTSSPPTGPGTRWPKPYYWHRFSRTKPELNYTNPRVRQAILRVIDFWCRLGVDGLRLDAVPYLYEQEGTICENLPETHAFLKELRRHVDCKFTNRMFAAEANQWPEDAATLTLAKGTNATWPFISP